MVVRGARHHVSDVSEALVPVDKRYEAHMSERGKDGKRYGLTLQQEQFCRAYMETGNASEAYRQAYPRSLKWPDKTVWEMASKAMARRKVAARIETLQAEAAQRHEVTIDTIAIQLDDDRKLAHGNGQAGPAVAASMGKAKLHGLLVDKHEDVTQPDDMGKEELAVYRTRFPGHKFVMRRA